MSAKQIANLLVLVFCIALTVVSFRNVYGDNADVERRARESAACPEGPCQLTRLDRSPFVQTFEFHRAGFGITVRCVRSAVLVGEYTCHPATST